MLNQVNLGARVVSDIVLRSTAQREIPVTDFRVIHKNSKLRHPLFIDVEVWGNEAQRVAENIKRGDMVVVVGELRRDVWQSRENNEVRSKIKITASKVVLAARPVHKDNVGSEQLMENPFSITMEKNE